MANIFEFLKKLTEDSKDALNPKLVSPIPKEDMVTSRRSKLLSPIPREPLPEVAPQKEDITTPLKLKVKTDEGEMEVPEEQNKIISSVFKNIEEAQMMADTLRHPRQQTYTPDEIETYGEENWNIGENPTFDLNAPDEPAAKGTIDRGFARINSATFKDMLSGKGRDKNGNEIPWPYWKDRANEEGIYTWDDMKDPVLNLRMARLIVERRKYNKSTGPFHDFYAAPLEAR